MAQAKLLAKDGTPCPYCHRTMDINDAYLKPTTDHVRPKSKGLSVHKHKKGAKKYGRTLIVCSECNFMKADLTLSAWVAHLKLTVKTIKVPRIAVLNNERILNVSYLVQIGLDKE